MMRAVVQEELITAVEDLFWELGDMATVTLRSYSKGTTSSSVTGGQQGRLPVGSPINAVGILVEREGTTQAGIMNLFVKPASLDGDVSLTAPDYEWTVQEPGGDELDVKKWRPLGPEPRNPVLWKGKVVEGADGA